MLLTITLDTFRRIDAAHDRHWHPQPVNDAAWDSDDLYFARLRKSTLASRSERDIALDGAL